MLSLGFYLLKVIIASAFLYGYYWVALRNKIFHQYNRFYLLVTVVLSLTLPLLQIRWWPSSSANNRVINMFSVVADGNAYMDEVVIRPAARHWTLESLLPFLYGAIAFFLLTLFIRTLVLIFRLLKQYPAERINGLYFVNTVHPSTPFSFLHYIFWNRQIGLDSVQGQQVFRHELAHVQERHTYDKLFMNLVLIVYWCNPVYWLIRKELNMIHEFIADRKAVEDSDTAAFAAMVLQAAYPQHRFSITNNFFYSPIKRRLLMLRKKQNPKTNYFGRILVLPLLALLALAFTLKKQNNTPLYAGKKITVMIDAGHGGTDPGANGGSQYLEKNLTLALTQQIKSLNQNPNIEILLTRDADQTMTPQERTALAKEKKADLFISFHCASALPAAQTQSGIAVYIPASQNSFFEKSKELAGALVTAMRQAPEIPVKEELIQRANGIWLLKSNNCPAVMIEAGYMSSQSDLSYISSAAYREKFAKAILEGITNYAASYFAAAEGTAAPIVSDKVPAGVNKVPGTPIKNIVYIVDGLETDSTTVHRLPGSSLASVNVLTGSEAVKKYGTRASDGAILIETKKVTGVKLDQSATQPIPDATKNAEATPLYIVDGKEASSDQVKSIPPSSIAEVNVLKGTDAIDQYGQKGTNGVVLITTKTGTSNAARVSSTISDQRDKIFDQTETPARFPGGAEGWKNYLLKNLDAAVPAREGWRHGTYTVNVNFIVQKDGSITDIKTENYPGSKTAQHCIELLKKSPRWEPAIQNGITVAAYRKQPISFVVE
ncbi:MAG: N-acetylmuramoyl-L-alanine amidase [Ferruginibacter sp.]